MLDVLKYVSVLSLVQSPQGYHLTACQWLQQLAVTMQTVCIRPFQPSFRLNIEHDACASHHMQAPPIALRSVLEGEIRGFAAHQGVDGHRQCMRKFLELLLARGEASVSCEVHCKVYAAGSTLWVGQALHMRC